jgi:ribonucleoside-diphosphate reductase alpha chain
MNELGLSENAVRIFKTLYSFQEETIEDTFERVADEFGNTKDEIELAYRLMCEGVWRPNTPAFLNAGKEDKVFSACYVVGLDDSMDSIYDVANVARKIFQYGSGIGIPIGNLRETDALIYEGDSTKIPEGKSSGPITFMKLYDAVGETTKSGGRVRRAAIMCAMPVWHPDIMDFITCKEEDGRLSNMNISVNITDKFMQCLKDRVPFELYTPHSGQMIGSVDSEELWDKLVEMSWKSADPGVIFIDNMNKFNSLKARFLIDTTNPCGEQPLQPFSCCNLSAINLAKFCKPMEGNEGRFYFDWDGLYVTTYDVMGLMDNVIDKMDYPDERFKENTQKYRQVGVGPMGLADAMFWLDMRYDSATGKQFAGEVMRIMTMACVDRSATLAMENKPFHDYQVFSKDIEDIVEYHIGHNINNEKTQAVMDKVSTHGLRNSQFTTCQPTGTTALSCDASYGIEPCFGLVFQKNVIDGTKMMVVNSVFEKRFRNESWYDANLINKIFGNGGSLKGIHGIPKEIRDTFIVAHDIKPKDRIDLQASLQRYCSTAISSTVNLPETSTKEEISDLYLYAFDKGLKGVTIYRDGCKENQPVTFKKEDVSVTTGFARPRKLQAEVFTVDTGNGKMYVTISSSNNEPIEIFLQVGKSGQVLNTFSEALGRVVSIALQNKVALEDIIKTLININSDKPVWFRFEETDAKPVQILSVPDGLAKLLQRYYIDQQPQPAQITCAGELCPLCGQDSVQMIEGCKTCQCGYSEC